MTLTRFVYNHEHENIQTSRHKRLKLCHRHNDSSPYPILFIPLDEKMNSTTIAPNPEHSEVVILELRHPRPCEKLHQQEQLVPLETDLLDVAKSDIAQSVSYDNTIATLPLSPPSSTGTNSVSAAIIESKPVPHHRSRNLSETVPHKPGFSCMEDEDNFASFHSSLILALPDPKLSCYFSTFKTKVATVLDSIVPVPVFQRIIPSMALTNPLLLDVIAACGAKFQLGKICKNKNSANYRACEADAKRYLERANRRIFELTEHMFSSNTPNKDRRGVTTTGTELEVVIVAALLVTIFEFTDEISSSSQVPLMSLQSLFRKYQLQTKEALSTSSSPFKTPIPPSDIIDACFVWNLQLDICLSRLLNRPPVVDPTLFDIDRRRLFVSPPSTVETLGAAQRNVSFSAELSRIMKLASQVQAILKLPQLAASSKTDLPAYQQQQQGFSLEQKSALTNTIREVQQWYTELQDVMRPSRELNKQGQFPEIYFPVPLCAIGHILYHLTMIELIESNVLPPPPSIAVHNKNCNDSNKSAVAIQCNYHAVRLCGIVLTNSATESLNLCFAWCLVLVAKYIYRQDQRDALLKKLQHLIDTGWASSTVGFVEHLLNIWEQPMVGSGLAPVSLQPLYPLQPF